MTRAELGCIALCWIACGHGGPAGTPATPGVLSNAGAQAPPDWQRCTRNVEFRAAAVLSGGRVAIGGGFTDGADLGSGPLTTVGQIGLRNDGFVASYDERNVLAWVRTIGAPWDDAVTGVVAGEDGSVVIAGQVYEGPFDLGGGPIAGHGRSDAFVAAYDATGKLRWARTFMSPGDDSISALATAAGGELVVVGSFGEGVELPGDGPHGAGSYAVRLSQSGDLRAARRLPGDVVVHASRILVHGDGAITIGGVASGELDLGDGPLVTPAMQSTMFLVQLRPSGERAWAKSFTSAGTNGPVALATDDAGQIYVAGGFQGTLDFGDGPRRARGADGFVAVYARDGRVAWTQQLVGSGGGSSRGGGDGMAHVTDVAADPSSGSVLVVGRYSGRLDVGEQHVESHAPYANFIARLSPGGEPRWVADNGARAVGDAGARLVIARDGAPIVWYRTGGETCFARRARWAR